MYENNNVNHETEQPEEELKNPLESFIHHQRRALEETGKALDSLVPPGFKEHGAEAGREFAKGFKVLVDAAITELEKMSKEMEKNAPEDGDRPSSTGPHKVKVQVE
jgi:hypothetical protein